MKRIVRNIFLNSFIYKLLGIIVLLALSVIITIYLFSNIIFLDANHHLIFFLIMVLVILFSLATFFIHRIIMPIHEINRGVLEISKGNFDVELRIIRKDELGNVARAFNQMTIALKKMIRSKEQLLLDVSHELRTPITRAKLALEIMPDSPEKESVIDDIREMEIMISELLETEQLKSGKAILNREKTNLAKLLDSVILIFASHEGKVKLNHVSEQLYITVDQTKINRVLKNIVENAVKYSEGSKQPVEISVIDLTGAIVIQVEDYGVGIPEDKLGFLFEPFYRVDNSRSRKTGGYGLGLHMAKKIMEAHNADIKIINKSTNEQSKGIIAELWFYKE